MSDAHPRCLFICIFALTACGVGAEEDLDQLETETTEQAVSAINHCAQGWVPNAVSSLPTFEDSYVRDNRLCRPNPQRDLSIVEYNGPNNSFARFVANANLLIADTPTCIFLPNVLTFIVERKVGSNWIEVENTTTQAHWTGSNCLVSHAFDASIFTFSPVGDYRFQAKARRYDAEIVPIQMIGYKTN